MIRIHGIPRSRAFRNIWAAEEAGIAYEVVPTDFAGAKDPAQARLHANGKLPTLEDGALILQESLAINLHIAMKAGAPLMPAGDDMSRVLQWSFFAATECEPSMMRWAYNTVIRPPEQRIAAEVSAGIADLTPRLAELEAYLVGRAWLVGASFSIADCNLACVLYPGWRNGYDFSAAPGVKAWLERCFNRPAALRARATRE